MPLHSAGTWAAATTLSHDYWLREIHLLVRYGFMGFEHLWARWLVRGLLSSHCFDTVVAADTAKVTPNVRDWTLSSWCTHQHAIKRTYRKEILIKILVLHDPEGQWSQYQRMLMSMCLWSKTLRHHFDCSTQKYKRLASDMFRGPKREKVAEKIIMYS